MDSFRTVFSIKAKRRAHAVAMEARGALLMMNRLVRSKRRHRSKILLGLDAQAVLFALRKGRSSAHEVRRFISAAAATSLAADVLFRCAYVPSICNPSDKPSRGIGRTHRAFIKRDAKARKSKAWAVKHLDHLRAVYARCGCTSRTSDFSEMWSITQQRC